MARDGKKQLKIWLSDDEHAALKARAEAEGVTVTDLIRARCLKAPARRKRRGPDVQELHRITAQLGRIGGNVNQLARVANENGRLPTVAMLQDTRAELRTMTSHLAQALGHDS